MAHRAIEDHGADLLRPGGAAEGSGHHEGVAFVVGDGPADGVVEVVEGMQRYRSRQRIERAFEDHFPVAVDGREAGDSNEGAAVADALEGGVEVLLHGCPPSFGLRVAARAGTLARWPPGLRR